jgi:NADPH-dependent 7-cyano-7-deazaguanine reductase QueF-like protein
MADADRWTRWNLSYTTREGRPVLAEASLWQLELEHPAAVERTQGGELYVHLDQTFRVEKFRDRAFRVLIPAERPRRGPP